MSVLLQAATPWPVVLLWLGAVVIAQVLKAKRKPTGSRPASGAAPPAEARADMGDALQRAMEKLKQAEREARQAPTPPTPARIAPRDRPAQAYLERQKSIAASRLRQEAREVSRRAASAAYGRRGGLPVARATPLEDHGGLSQETEPEVVDYDDDAASLEEGRVRAIEASERGGDEGASVVPRIAPAGAAERARSARPPDRPTAPLGRFGDGSLRGAMILSEILGRPLSDR